MAFFLVLEHRDGAEWQPGRPADDQAGWEAHAAYMDSLVGRGLIVLGGPLADDRRVVLVFEAESEDAVRAVLAADPWIPSHLSVESVEPWTIRLDGRVNQR